MKFSVSSIAALGLLLASSLPAAGATFTVTNTADSGAGSLRQAIIDSNTNPPPANTANVIQFSLPGSGVQTITLGSALPPITIPVTIDGYTQPGSSANTVDIGDNAVLLVRIDAGSFNVFFLGTGSDGSTIRGLAIVNGSTIFDLRSNNNIISGNFIGVDTDGATFAGAGNVCVAITTGVSGNAIGGTTPGARNVAAATGDAFQIEGTGTTVAGNYINTNAAGTAALGSSGNAINIDAGTGTMILGNVLGTWRANGINISQGNIFLPVGNITIQGNFIGTDVTGKVGLTAGLNGIALGTVDTVTIGGSASGAGNVISHASNDGIVITGTANAVTIQGNRIGTDITGTANLGNGQNGIRLRGSTTSGLIGGTTPAAGNVIAFNATNGIAIANNDTGWSILGNSIFSNTSIGITLGGRPDLANDPTPNDPGDTDTGANNLQNYPVLTSVSDASGGGVTVSGSLNSTPNTKFRIEFFGNDAIDPTGFGEGQTFVGSTDVTTDGNGAVNFNVKLSNVGAKQHITATATGPDGSTSEFSAAIGQLLNISTRMEVLTGDNVLIGGFIITGSQNVNVLLRAIGPSLPVSNALADPVLELHDGSGKIIATNDNWKDSQQSEIAATGIPPVNDLESAMVQSLAPGAYTAIVRGKDNGTGVGLVEAYDLDHFATTKLANISTRGFVDTGDNVMIGGFIAANGITRVLVRGIGPSLPVSGTLADPTLELHDANGTLLATNDNWKEDAQQAEIAATGIPPNNDVESALIQTLTPGNYTAIVRGKNDGTGVGQVELYNVQ